MKHLFKILTIVSIISLSVTSTMAGAEAKRILGPIASELETAVNTQVRHEFEAAYFYLAMANHFEQQSLFGFSHWFTVQFFEETTHARLLMKFLADKGNDIKLEPIQPTQINKSATPLEIADIGVNAEETQTGRIHALYELARNSKAYDLENYLSWFVKEQIQEEANFNDLKQKLKVVGSSPEGLLALDRDLAKRLMPVVQPLPIITPAP